MTADRIRRLLAQVQTGGINAEEAARRLKTLPYENLGFAAVDHHRVFRQGMAEAIFCEGKTVGQAVAIASRLLRNRHPVLATRVEPTLARALLRLDRRARYEPLGRTVVLAPPKGWAHFGKAGAGHFVKMVHNGIEYGMMQAYGEGFELLHASEFGLDMKQVAGVWMQGSVVRSWLLELAERAFEQEGSELANIKGWVADSGEGRWTILEAISHDVPATVLAHSLFARFVSRQEDSYAMKVAAALRNQFGGHAVKKE